MYTNINFIFTNVGFYLSIFHAVGFCPAGFCPGFFLAVLILAFLNTYFDESSNLVFKLSQAKLLNMGIVAVLMLRLHPTVSFFAILKMRFVTHCMRSFFGL